MSGATEHYHAGWNTPGCLPEMEPPVFHILEDAYAWLAEQVRDWADAADCDNPAEDGEPCGNCPGCQEATEWRLAADVLSFCSGVQADGLVPWVEPCSEPGCITPRR